MSFKTKRNRPMLMKNRTYYTLKTLKPTYLLESL